MGRAWGSRAAWARSLLGEVLAGGGAMEGGGGGGRGECGKGGHACVGTVGRGTALEEEGWVTKPRVQMRAAAPSREFSLKDTQSIP